MQADLLQAQYFTSALFTLLHSIICIDLCTVVLLLGGISLFLHHITDTNVRHTRFFCTYFYIGESFILTIPCSLTHTVSTVGKERSCTFTENAWNTWQISQAFINTFLCDDGWRPSIFSHPVKPVGDQFLLVKVTVHMKMPLLFFPLASLVFPCSKIHEIQLLWRDFGWLFCKQTCTSPSIIIFLFWLVHVDLASLKTPWYVNKVRCAEFKLSTPTLNWNELCRWQIMISFSIRADGKYFQMFKHCSKCSRVLYFYFCANSTHLCLNWVG